jgi:hypothetical protein
MSGLTGTSVTSRPGGIGCAAVWVVLGLAAVGAAAGVPNVHWAVFAILPFVLAFGAWFSVEQEVRFEITEDGLSFEAPETVYIRYRDIEGLTGQGLAGRNQFAMQVYHSEGVVRIPASIDVPSWELRDHILDRLPPVTRPDPDDVPGTVRGFVADQIEKFGEDKVFVYRARRHPPASTYGRAVAYSAAFAVAGLFWAIAGGVLVGTLPKKEADGATAWIAGGIVLFILALLFAFLFSRQHRAGRVKNWESSCLVVSPGGIALAQGPLKGKMRWDELRAIEFPAKPRFGLTAAGATSGIGLLVEGAYLIIADYYDRPLFLIHEQLQDYWGGRHAN